MHHGQTRGETKSPENLQKVGENNNFLEIGEIYYFPKIEEEILNFESMTKKVIRILADENQKFFWRKGQIGKISHGVSKIFGNKRKCIIASREGGGCP